MAVTSTKGTSRSTKATPAGKDESGTMPLSMQDATTPTVTLQTIAESLVALELDLAEAKKAGYRWQSLPLKSKAGLNMLAIVIYRPNHSVGAEKSPSGTIFTLDGIPASVLATREKV